MTFALWSSPIVLVSTLPHVIDISWGHIHVMIKVWGRCYYQSHNPTNNVWFDRSFCIKELLFYIQMSSSDNIIFIFASIRGSCYTLGNLVVPIKALLKRIQDASPHVVIRFNGSTVYCIGMRYSAWCWIPGIPWRTDARGWEIGERERWYPTCTANGD